MRPDRDHAFYPALAILISAIGFAGFAFTYFGPIIGGSYPPTGAALHVHGWSFFLWYLLFPLQAVLIAKGKYALHMTLGRISIVLVVLMTFTGVLVLTVRVEEAVRTGAPQIWLLYGPLILSNLILFLSGFHPLSLPAGTPGCSLFIVIGMFYDRFTHRRVHPVYWIGLTALLVVEISLLPQVNEDGVALINQGLAAIGDYLGILYQPNPTVEF